MIGGKMIKLSNGAKILRLEAQILDLQATILYHRHIGEYRAAKAGVEKRKKAINYLKENKEHVTWDKLNDMFKVDGRLWFRRRK